MCDSIEYGWWYDPNINRCEPYQNGGCDVGGNEFHSYEVCASACGAAAWDFRSCPVKKPRGECAQEQQVCLCDLITDCRCVEWPE